MVTLEMYDEIFRIKDSVHQQYGDRGSCVLGFNMYVDGKRLMYQPWQGSLSCEVFYDRVKKYLIEQGVDPDKITIDYGRLD